MQNEVIEIEIVRLMKTTTANAYRAWISPDDMKQWLMTTPVTNTSIQSEATEGGTYEIRDRGRDKERVVTGTYEQLVPYEHIRLTIQMPEISDETDAIDVYFEERSPGITQMTFRYQSVMEKPRGMSNLVYKQEKKAYHDHTAHGFELMFDTLQAYLESQPD
ncbi:MULTISPECIES: SRPBCC domain-containing protein [unclassified Staphylococcus]|uniref:SRPBCC family protein n=1 Tax=unclassified Staphylococcus TaxID=91994 RepID=UPI0021D10B8B|nr:MULTISPECIES: SRPBCC domain-containing protein [unclassified Staphylococcus]UXR78047.1 SRPBCC domain-containing protein [Staphylococcus sp. IVB6227]UXR82210.1 SRPBCC domain-containing protein [Staphylococcus sp. IVB6214]